MSTIFQIKLVFRRVVGCKADRVIAYSSTREQSNKRSGTRLKTESETGEFFPLASHAHRARELRARRIHTPRFTDFFTDFEKKQTVLQSSRVENSGVP